MLGKVARTHLVVSERTPLRRDLAMLVLSRRIGEEIVIGDNVRVVVVANTGSSVRLGVVAPQSMAVRRLNAQDGLQGPDASPWSLGIPVGSAPVR
jgi:carbon storage regulator